MNAVYAFFYQQQISLAKNFIRASTDIDTPLINIRDICIKDSKKVTRIIFFFPSLTNRNAFQDRKIHKNFVCSHRLKIYYLSLHSYIK